jgi:hypothetical protein
VAPKMCPGHWQMNAMFSNLIFSHCTVIKCSDRIIVLKIYEIYTIYEISKWTEMTITNAHWYKRPEEFLFGVDIFMIMTENSFFSFRKLFPSYTEYSSLSFTNGRKILPAVF